MLDVVGGKESLLWVWRRMARMKKLPADVMETPLNRCLNTLDITLLGIGHMVGAGVYVLIGTVAKDNAGPAIILSFLMAGFVSILSALCYAEFGARVPKAGSAYAYAYVSVGEFWAFVIGWNIILEYMIGAASVARAWSGYIDSLFGGAISNYTEANLISFHEDFLAPYPDPVAFCVTLIYCSFLSIGVKASSYFNSAFTMVNMFVISFVIVVGMFLADGDNWNTSGGFAPFGMSGVIAGAATSFYAFVGFDSIATSSEEAISPKRSIPIATITSMTIVTIGYVLVGAVLTLMVPFYEIHPSAALPEAFASNGLYWAKYVVTVGALCGMTTTLFGSLFSLPRCVYAMASDGLLFSWLAQVSSKTQVPVLNIAVCGFLTAFISLLFDIEKLVEFMSIGTLMAYTIVSASVIILRYKAVASYTSQEPSIKEASEDTASVAGSSMNIDGPENAQGEGDREGGPVKPIFKNVLRFIPPSFEDQVVTWAVGTFTIAVACFSSLLMWGSAFLESPVAVWAIFLVVILLSIIVICVMVIAAHQQDDAELSFRVPFVPYLPLLSIFCNISLMVHLNPMTWVRFLIWMILGLLLYFCYGIHNSKEGQPVTAYSSLLSESKTASGAGVFGAVHQKLSQVTSKLVSAAAQGVNGDSRKTMDTESALQDSTEQQPIIDKEASVTEN